MSEAPTAPAVVPPTQLSPAAGAGQGGGRRLPRGSFPPCSSAPWPSA